MKHLKLDDLIPNKQYLYKKDYGEFDEIVIMKFITKVPDGKYLGIQYHGEPFELFENEVICEITYDDLKGIHNQEQLRKYVKVNFPEFLF